MTSNDSCAADSASPSPDRAAKPPVYFPVETGHILMFARAIGDLNPVYRDESSAAAVDVGGVIAPPTFVQASAQFDPDYSLRPRIGEPWLGSGRSASGKSSSPDTNRVSGSLHAEQHFEYHLPVRPGDILTATTVPGRNWEKRGRSGRLLFAEFITEFRNQRGELAVTARGVGVRTEPAAAE